MAGTLMATALIVPAVATLAAGSVGPLAVSLLAALSRRRARRGQLVLVPMAARTTTAPAYDAPFGSVDPGSRQPKAKPLQLLAPYAFSAGVRTASVPDPRVAKLGSRACRVGLGLPRNDHQVGMEGAGRVGLHADPAAGPSRLLHPACLPARLPDLPCGGIVGGYRQQQVDSGLGSIAAAGVPFNPVAGCRSDRVDRYGHGVDLGARHDRGHGERLSLPGPVGRRHRVVHDRFHDHIQCLFAGLQRDVSQLLAIPPAVLLAAQTAGGNVGNATAPVVILVGAAAVGVEDVV